MLIGIAVVVLYLLIGVAFSGIAEGSNAGLDKFETVVFIFMWPFITILLIGHFVYVIARDITKHLKDG